MRISPGFRFTRNSPRCSRWVSSSQARLERHDVVAVLVELDDLGLERLSDVGLQVANPTQLDERRGQEAAKAYVDDEPALDDLDDEALHDAAGLLDPFDRAPGALVLGTLFRQDEATLLVLFLEHEGFDLVADRDNLVRVEIVANGKLTGRDDAFGLEADVEEHLVLVDLYHFARDDVPVLEGDDRLVDGVLEGHVAKVVLDDLAGDVDPFGVKGAMTLLICQGFRVNGAHRVGHGK